MNGGRDAFGKNAPSFAPSRANTSKVSESDKWVRCKGKAGGGVSERERFWGSPLAAERPSIDTRDMWRPERERERPRGEGDANR